MKYTNLLQQADYSLVLPNEKLHPLSLILQKRRNIFSFFSPKEGSAVNAELKDLFYAKGRGVKYPKIQTSGLPQSLSGSDIIAANSRFASHLFSKKVASASAEFEKSKKVLLNFENAEEHYVNQIILDEYLQFATLNEYAPTFSEAVKDGKMYIVLSALTADKLELSNADDFNLEGDISVPAMRKYVRDKLQAGKSSTKTATIENDGKPLVFAVKTAQIKFENDQYRIIPAGITVRKATEDHSEHIEEGAELVFE